MPQDEGDVSGRAGDGPGSEAVVDEHLVPLPLQIGRDGEEPQGGHSVGRGRDVLPAGDPVGSGRVNQNDAHVKTSIPSSAAPFIEQCGDVPLVVKENQHHRRRRPGDGDRLPAARAWPPPTRGPGS